MELGEKRGVMTSKLDEFIPRISYSTLMPYEPYRGVVYHYTSLSNIKSILLREGGALLWASRHDCLNDASEGTLPRLRFRQVCDRLSKEDKLDEAFLNVINNVQPNKTDLIIPTNGGKKRPVRDSYKTYIVSFSEDSDSLAMWNYYSKGSHYEGMNIGIDTQVLLNSLNSTLNKNGTVNIQAAKVIYDEDEQLEIIEEAILDLRRAYTPGHETSVRFCVGTLLAKLGPVFKLDYFSYEREVRLFVQVFKKFEIDNPVKYRSNAGFVIPYIELEFDKNSISEITLGPALSDEKQKLAQKEVAQEMMRSYGYGAQVDCSRIPVRF